MLVSKIILQNTQRYSSSFDEWIFQKKKSMQKQNGLQTKLYGGLGIIKICLINLVDTIAHLITQLILTSFWVTMILATCAHYLLH